MKEQEKQIIRDKVKNTYRIHYLNEGGINSLPDRAEMLAEKHTRDDERAIEETGWDFENLLNASYAWFLTQLYRSPENKLPDGFVDLGRYIAMHTTELYKDRSFLVVPRTSFAFYLINEINTVFQNANPQPEVDQKIIGFRGFRRNYKEDISLWRLLHSVGFRFPVPASKPHNTIAGKFQEVGLIIEEQSPLYKYVLSLAKARQVIKYDKLLQIGAQKQELLLKSTTFNIAEFD
jgi:hypothetical protein